MEKIKKDGDGERTRLDKDLEVVKEELRTTKVARDALDARYQKEISQHQTDSEARLHQLDQQLTELRSTLEEQKQKHDSATREAEELRSKLITDARNHTSEQEARSKELTSVNERYSQAEELIEELKEEVATVRRELADVRIQVESLQTENTDYQQANTGLEAENQRSLSLIRYLESQVKDLYVFESVLSVALIFMMQLGSKQSRRSRRTMSGAALCSHALRRLQALRKSVLACKIRTTNVRLRRCSVN